MGIDSLLDPASSGHWRSCFHISTLDLFFLGKAATCHIPYFNLILLLACKQTKLTWWALYLLINSMIARLYISVLMLTLTVLFCTETHLEKSWFGGKRWLNDRKTSTKECNTDNRRQVSMHPQANAKFVQTGANVHDLNHTANIGTSTDTAMARKEASKKKRSRGKLIWLATTYFSSVTPTAVPCLWLLNSQNICLSWLRAQPLCSSPAALNKDAKRGWLLTMESELLDVKC